MLSGKADSLGGEAIFISYRRSDSADASGRIYDRLRTAFGKSAVFKDVDAIPAGQDFRGHVASVLNRCRVCLVLLGPDWLDATNENGSRRLDDPDDLVRVEIETALGLGLTIIPVLLGDAVIPQARQLPGKLAALPSLHCVDVRRDPDFHKDMDKLVGDLRRHALRALTLRRALYRIGLASAVIVAMFAIGIAGALLTLEANKTIEAQQDENRRQRVLEELGLDARTADDNSASIRLIEILGDPADVATQRRYQGRFEAVGLNPYWAMQLVDDRVLFQFDYGHGFQTHAGVRVEFYQGGMAVPFENNGSFYSFIVRHEPCELMNGVVTGYRAYALVDGTVFSGCADRGLSRGWPLDDAGSDRWALPAAGEHD